MVDLNERKFYTVDLFSGCGGLTLGFRNEGFQSLLGIEYNPQQAGTFQANLKEIPVICKDIRDVSQKEVENYIKGLKIDALIAGPPCEGFSNAGKRAENDPRNDLFKEVIKFADLLEPTILIIENVPGLLTMKKGEIIEEIHQKLKKSGYFTEHVILNAVNFGVPQTRLRLFIIALKEHGIEDIKKALENVKEKQVSAGDAISDLPPLKPGEEKNQYEETPTTAYQLLMRKENGHYLDSHRALKHKQYMVDRFKYICQGEGMAEVWDRIPKNLRPEKPYSARCRRLDPALPSPTVTAHCVDELIHPKQDRQITPREAARLQSFPDNYIMIGRYAVSHGDFEQDRYEQIGDAVPPLLAQGIAREIRKYL